MMPAMRAAIQYFYLFSDRTALDAG